MIEFGEYTNLTKEIAGKIQDIISKLKELNDNDIAIYYGYPFYEVDQKMWIIKGFIVSKKGIIGLYETDDEKTICNRYFLKQILDSQKLSEMIFRGINIVKLVQVSQIQDIIRIFNEDDIYGLDIYLEINSIIQRVYGLNKEDNREVSSENTLGAIIKKRNNKMSMLDSTQFDGIYNSINTHMRIRGLAGSGKTILLVKKMAYTHFKDRSLDLVYVFYTKSLKQYVEALFKNFYRDFEQYKDPDMSKIHILHSWGGSELDGFYSEVCKSNGLECLSYGEAKYIANNTNDRFDAVCQNVVSNNNLKRMYDYVFIDEAQDFKLSFFKLVKSTLKSNGKIIYAYDELQSLNSTSLIPSKDKIFNLNEECKDVDLSICYRTPKEIIVVAHALGLGIYKKDSLGNRKIVNMMEDFNIWKAIGYEVVSGELGYGKHVVLSRNEVIEYKPSECVEIKMVNNESEQYNEVASQILKLVRDEDILLEDILIIDLSTIDIVTNFNDFRKVLNEKPDANNMQVQLVDKNNPIEFKKKQFITYTSIFRAKGNEANIVFVLNAHKMSSLLTYSRNQLFTAMTRAKFKTFVYGVENEMMLTLCEEYNEIKNKNYTLDFVYPTKEELGQMTSIAKVEFDNVYKLKRVYDDIGNDDKRITIEILKEQFKAASISELISKLKNSEYE